MKLQEFLVFVGRHDVFGKGFGGLFLDELNTLWHKVIVSKYAPHLFKCIVAMVLKGAFRNSWKYIAFSCSLFSNFIHGSIRDDSNSYF